MESDDFGEQLNRRLSGENIILNKAKGIASPDDKIEYIFNEVKNNIKWNEYDARFTDDGTSEAWKKKTGNSTEVNLILYHLLTEAGVKAYPMLVSTRDNGKVNPAFPNHFQFNRTVVYIPNFVGFYVLDATGKYNVYNEVPEVLLNSMGFYIDKEHEKYEVIFLRKAEPVTQMITVNADIKPDGKMTGSARINSSSYNRINTIKKFKTDGEKKYSDYLLSKNNALKISGIKFENMDTDSLPLIQHIDFALDLTSSDGNYIYINPNLFASLRQNPFLSEKRLTNIDFGYCNNYVISDIYKVPAGYKVDASPKSVSMALSGNNISFKRIVSEDDGKIVIRYFIVYRKSVFFKEDYPEFHDFYKKMFEMLNEQIVLKKV